jgi:xylulokinase
MAKKYILAHDMGTGGSKAVLYDADGAMLAKAFHSYETLYPQPRWAEQRPEDWWDAIVKGTRQVLSAVQIDKNSIAAISFSGHGMGNVPVDAKGNLLRDTSMVWFDSRSSDQANRVVEKIGLDRWYEITGCAFDPAFFTGFKLMWVKENEPDLFEKTHVFLATKDYIVMRLTGKFATDYSDMSFTGLFDVNEREFSTELMKASGIPREKFPSVYPSTHVAGDLLPEPARELDLPSGIPVVLGGEDVPCTAAGAGVVSEGRIYAYIGTSGWVSVASPKALRREGVRIPNIIHVVPGMYTPQMGVYSAGSTYQWVQDRICQQEVAAAKDLDVDPFSLMEIEAASSPVGSNGLLFLSTFAGGGTIHENNPDLKGAYIGIGPAHTRADLIRAAMEGVSLDLGLLVHEFKGLGIEAPEIRVVGGGGKSPLWRQILADVFESRVIMTNIGQEAAALGAAMIGGVGVGLWGDFGIVDELTKLVSISEPRQENSVKYRQLLPIFRDAVSVTSGICTRLAGAA